MKNAKDNGLQPSKSNLLTRCEFLFRSGFFLMGVFALVVVFWFPPMEHDFYPRCTFHDVTGFHCPGCGGFRAWHELLHGRFVNALHMNAVAVTLLPGIMLWSVLERFLPTNRDFWNLNVASPRMILALAVIVLVFGGLRNIPWGPFRWLAP